MSIVPNSRPRISTADIRGILNGANPQRLRISRETYPVAILGIRGYYCHSMGDPDANDRGIYDDAIIIDAPEITAAYNANCDPSVHRPGIANLCTGLWWYKVGTHGLSKPKDRQYTALVQAAEVTVHRDQEGADTGLFGINIHRGSATGTSSLGCQTIYPDQWESFIATVRDHLKRHNQTKIPYLLIDGPVN